MFGIGFSEMFFIIVVAVIALGPEKLPKTLIEIARYFKIFKKTVNDAKSMFDQEVKIAELKEDAKKYKESINKTTEGIRKKLTFEELDEIKNGLNSAKNTLNAGLDDLQKDIEKATKSVQNSNVTNPKSES